MVQYAMQLQEVHKTTATHKTWNLLRAFCNFIDPQVLFTEVNMDRQTASSAQLSSD